MDYNNKIKFVSIAARAFDRAGFYRFFPNSLVVTGFKENWTHSKGMEYSVLSLEETCSNLKLNENKARFILNNTCFSRLYKENLHELPIIVYKNVEEIEKIASKNNLNLIGPKSFIRNKLEEKDSFRRILGKKINVPKYEIYENIDSLPPHEYFNTKWGRYVIQDSHLSGGNGTFIINSPKQYRNCKERLKEIDLAQIIVSKFVRGTEASIQMCMTKYGLLHNGLQKQIVGCQQLTINESKPVFAGGIWEKGLNKKLTKKFLTDLKEIEKILKKINYKGVLGADLIIGNDGEIYFIEINARLTGMSPIIGMLQEIIRVPHFLTLHVLEHTNSEYTISKEELYNLKLNINKIPNITYAKYSNIESSSLTVKTQLNPGIYALDGERLIHKKITYHIEDLSHPNEFLLIEPPNINLTISPGEKAYRIVTPNIDYHLEEKSISANLQRIINTINQKLFY